jgi:hypothetical protein
MKLRDQTAEIQNQLGDYCRTGIMVDLPGLNPEGVKHYRRLVYNVVRDTLDTAYPISFASLGENLWDEMVQDFFSNHGGDSPQLWKMPLEFYEYHYEKKTSEKLNKPYLNDLLYFEWIEIEIHTMPDRPFPAYQNEGDIFTDVMAINPEFDLVRLEYPIHMFPVDEAVDKKGEYYLLIFRVPETGHVQFVNLSVIYTYLLGKIYEKGQALNDFKATLAHMAGIESEKFLDETLEKFIKDLIKKRFILGFRKK